MKICLNKMQRAFLSTPGQQLKKEDMKWKNAENAANRFELFFAQFVYKSLS